MKAPPDPFHGLAPPPEEPAAQQAWFEGRLSLLLDLNIDRALAPASRHALVELLFDPVEDESLPPPEPDDLPLSGRLAERLGITPRGARKALSELETLGLIESRGSGALVLPGAIAAHLHRGTDAPPMPDADPTVAHAARLEGLRNLALGDGLVATALAAQRAAAHALGYRAPPRLQQADDDILTRPPAEQRGLHFDRAIRFLRDFYIGDPDYQDDMLAWIAAVRARSGSGSGEAAASPFETAATQPRQDEAPDWKRLGRPHPEEREARLEG